MLRDQRVTICYADSYRQLGEVVTYEVVFIELIANNSILKICIKDNEYTQYVPLIHIKWFTTEGIDI